jgi:hypothetical protein
LERLIHIGSDLLQIIVVLLQLAGTWGLLIAWVAWWLGAANWKRLWPVLAEGGWAPLTLLTLMGALVWSRIAPTCPVPGLQTLPSPWWQVGAAGLIVGLTLFCGWLQGVLGWTPPEIDLDPPAVAPDHGHGHH